MRVRSLVSVVAVLVALVVSAGPALGHTEVQRATPAPGAVVTSDVDSIELLFLDPVLPTVRIDVATVDGAPVDDLGSVEHSDDGRTATVSFAPLTDPGDYVVDYEFVAADGDAQADAYRFSFDPDDDDGTDPARLLAVVAVLAAVAAGLVIALRRRAKRGDHTQD